MAQPKVPKKALKSVEKTTEKKISKKKKKKRKESFDIYIYNLMKSVTPDNFRISCKAMLIMDNFVNDFLEKLAMEAGRLVIHGKKKTMGSREIESAVRLLLPPELAKHANMEGTEAITTFHNSVTGSS